MKYFKEALIHNPKEVRALICIGNAKYDKGVSIIFEFLPNYRNLKMLSDIMKEY